jgi:hypothetical protein
MASGWRSCISLAALSVSWHGVANHLAQWRRIINGGVMYQLVKKS